SDINECKDIATKVWKHNLACLVLARLNMMQLSLKPDQKDWGLIEKGQRIASVLGKSFTLELIEAYRAKAGKQSGLRTVNKLAMKVRLRSVEENQRKKQWLLVAKENSRWDIRRVVRKEQETILMEHLIQESQNETTETIVERCKGCNQNRLETSQSCEEQTERSNIVGVLPTRPHGNGKRKLDLNIDAILRWEKRREVKGDDMLELPQRLEEAEESESDKKHTRNEVADQLAKKGLEVTDRQRCPRCQFMKVLTNLKIELEWCLMKAITKEELQDKDMKFKWSLLWNRIKRQNGIRCTSMRKNRRLG
ncbi:7562_t:CDS:2, partial [Gigaspora rosea]